MKLHNYTPESYASSSQPMHRKRTRSRPALSCQRCRSRKVACDRSVPCNNCSRNRVDCVYGSSDTVSRGSGVARMTISTSSPFDSDNIINQPRNATNDPSMDIRLERLERIVEQLASKVDQISASSTPSASDSTSRAMTSEIQPTPYSEGVLASRQPGTIYYIGRTGWSMAYDEKCIMFTGNRFAEQWAAWRELEKRFQGWRNEAIVNCTISAPTPLDIQSSILGMIPDQDVSNILIHRFFITFNAVYPVVDVKMFQAEVKDFWRTRQPKSTMWLGLFLAVLALGYMLPVVPLPPGKSSRNGRIKGKRLMSTVRYLIFTSSVGLRRTPLCVFQMLLILMCAKSLDLDWVDGNDSVQGLLGLGARLAFTMGLHRDSSLARNLSKDEANLRSMLWSTFKSLDFERSMQCGMPFLLRDSDSDVQDPDSTNSFWPEYQRCFSRALPVWACVAQLCHSRKAVITDLELLELKSRMATITPLTQKRVTLLSSDSSERKAEALQYAVFSCSHHRMLMILHSPCLKDNDAIKRGQSREIVYDSSRAILAQQISLHEMIVNEPDGDAWAHLFITLLQCNVYYAINNMLMLIRFSCIEDDYRGRSNFNHSALFEDMKSSMKILGGSLSLSPCNIKGYMMMCALVQGMKERLRLCFELQTNNMEIIDAEAGSVVRVMELAMQKSLEESEMAINEALAAEDPPAALCKDIQDGNGSSNVEVHDTQVMGTQQVGNAGEGGNEAVMSDWIMDSDPLSDFDMTMPWWFPSSLYNEKGWDPVTWVNLNTTDT